MKLTDSDIELPDVTLRIHQDRLALNVSKEIEDALRTYAHGWKLAKNGVLTITLSGYIYRDEIEPLLKKQ